MRTRATGALAIALVASAAPGAAAGGFYVPEIGARAVGLGAAVVADGDDPSAIFHDPAGIAGSARGLHVELAGGLFFPHVTFFRRPETDPNTGAHLHFDPVRNQNAVIAAPSFGVTRGLGHDLTAGLAVYTPFGATLDYPVDGAQRQVVTGISLRTIYVSPALALALPRGFAIGAAANLIYADLALDQRNALPYVTGDPEQYPDPDPGIEGTTQIRGRDAFSIGATAGATWRSADARLSAGASVMTPVTLHFTGDAHVENAGIAPLDDAQGHQLQAAGAREDQVRIAMPLPLIARLGVAVRPAPGWRVEADVNWSRWSTFQRLDVDFVHHYVLIPTPGAYLYDVHDAMAWHDSWTARVGVEAKPWARPFTARAGVVLDQSPIDDRHFSLLTPDADKLAVAAGAGWTHGHLAIDVAYNHVFLRERDVAPAADGSPGSDGTILNKPAPSFFHGVTRTGFDIVSLAVAWRQ